MRRGRTKPGLGTRGGVEVRHQERAVGHGSSGGEAIRVVEHAEPGLIQVEWLDRPAVGGERNAIEDAVPRWAA